MAHQTFFRGILAAGVLAACAGTNPGPSFSPAVEAASAGRTEEAPGLIPYLRFVPEGFPAEAIPPGVGSAAGDAGLDDETRRSLEGSFRSAYLETLFLGLPLRGVLGEDRVHLWPAGEPLCWVQNWRNGLDYPNSWGLSRLVLALENPVSRRVFAVYGPILDAYGKSAGVNGANGAAGYGCPRGPVFLSGGCLVQRFDLGSFQVDGDGVVSFLPGEPPQPTPPGMVGSFADENQTLRNAFRTAWSVEVERNLPPVDPDGPVEYIDFAAAPWSSGGLRVTGMYIQTFDHTSVVFVLVESSDLPFQVSVLTGPFLGALLTASPLDGAGRLIRDSFQPSREIGNRFTAALLQGMSVYGPPLSGVLPYDDGGVWRDAQRFSKGWMVYAPPPETDSP